MDRWMGAFTLTCCAVAAGLMCNVAFMIVPLQAEIGTPPRPVRWPATIAAVGLLAATVAVLGVVATA